MLRPNAAAAGSRRRPDAGQAQTLAVSFNLKETTRWQLRLEFLHVHNLIQ